MLRVDDSSMVNERLGAYNENIKSTVSVYFRLVYNIESKRNHLPCFSNTERLGGAVIISDGRLNVLVKLKLFSN